MKHLFFEFPNIKQLFAIQLGLSVIQLGLSAIQIGLSDIQLGLSAIQLVRLNLMATTNRLGNSDSTSVNDNVIYSM